MSGEQPTTSNREAERKAEKDAYRKSWYLANKERIAAKKASRYQANREHFLAKQSAYNAANKEKRAAAAKAWRASKGEDLAQQKKAYREANRERLLANQKAHYHSNKPAIAAKAKAYREANKERIAAADRLKRYGLTQERFSELLAACEGRCPLCKLPFSKLWNHQVCVDHCHKSGIIRGLLCQQCNRMLGCARDNPALLRAGIRYLEKHKVDLSASS